MGIYRLKQIVRRPIVWRRRRQFAALRDDQRHIFEVHMYSRAVGRLAMDTMADLDVLYRHDLDASSTVWVVGAFRGDAADRLHALHGARIHCFEPGHRPYDHMVRRFADRPDVVPLPYGLGVADEEATLHVAGPGSSLHGAPPGAFGTEQVRIRAIGDVMDELDAHRIDLMQVNIEGAEYDLLDHMIDTGLIDRVERLAIQFHEWHPRAHGRRRRIRRRLAATHEQVWDYDWVWELWKARSAQAGGTGV